MPWANLEEQIYSREYHEGTVLANVLGLQLARTFLMNKRIRRAIEARAPKPDSVRDALVRDGAVLIPDYLPADVFAQVRAEFCAAKAAGLLVPQPPVEDNDVLEERIAVGKNKQQFPVTRRVFGEQTALRELVGDVIGQTPDDVSLVISVMHKSPVPVTPVRLVGTNYIHADVHFPTIKAWLYLNDVDESNGATMYALGSLRITLARLAYEYDASVRVAKAKSRHEVHSAVPYGLARMPTAAQLERMGARAVSMNGKANTLFIANTMGFHRRGDFQPGTTRDLLAIRFNDRTAKKTS
jgi:hypothetical protein